MRIMSASDRQDRNAGRKSFVNPTQDCQSGGSGSETTIPAEFHYQAPHHACTLHVTLPVKQAASGRYREFAHRQRSRVSSCSSELITVGRSGESVAAIGVQTLACLFSLPRASSTATGFPRFSGGVQLDHI